MVLGLAKQSTVEEKESKIQELQQKKSQQTRNYKRVDSSFKILKNQLPTLDIKYDVVESVPEPTIAYKATENCVATLLLPAGTVVVYPSEEAQDDELWHRDKLRCSMAKVVRLEGEHIGESQSNYGQHRIGFDYTIGETVTPDHLNTQTENVCTHGIHIFREKNHAIEWLQEY